ncbi:hypothetical protein GCM10027020_30170 [Nocardioides salsibiostraticola]
MTPEPSPEVSALRDLHRVVMLVHSGQDLTEVLQVAAEGVAAALGFESATINLLTPRGDYEAVTSVGPGAALLHGTRNDRAEFESELSIADAWGSLRFVPAGRYAVPAGVVVFRPDEEPLDVPDAWHPDDALYAPLRDQSGEMLGILSVDLPLNRRRPSLLKQQCLEMYAVQIGLAIAHARERERLEQRVRLTEVISSVTNAVAEASELDVVLDASLTPIRVGFQAELAWLRLFSDEQAGWAAANYARDLTDWLRPSPAATGDERPVVPQEDFDAAAQLAQACWHQRRPVVVTDCGHDTSRGMLTRRDRQRILDWLRGVELDTFILFPVGTAHHCAGFVSLARRASAGEWTPTEEDAASDVGRELGRAISMARARKRETQLLRKLEEIDTHKNEMIATVVHELKNPLTSIRGNLELMEDDPEVADRASSAIAFNVDRMLGLVQNMLTLSRLRDPRTELHAVLVDLTAMVLSLESLVEIQAQRSGVVVCFENVEADISFHGNREGLERMMVNLVSNAVKFSEPGTQVRVSLSAAADAVEFTVVDHGLGISVNEQNHLFEEFHRSDDPEARARPGTGLGLAIVARIVERHGGRIRVDSDLGVGSTFAVRLPVAG